MTTSILELLTWKSTPSTSDDTMILAMNNLKTDMKAISGFIQQTLYKNSSNQWVCIYYWETEQNAHDSNMAVANKDSFKQVMSLIQPESLSIDVMNPLD